MEDTSVNKQYRSKKEEGAPISLGILAHVDAGKTTLAESLLYTCGQIRTLGRVDHQDAFLDTHELERRRGITIFSKQARLKVGEFEVTLLDTPGHVDFSAEMERTLQILDYAILVISGADGVQGHVQTLWKLLDRYQVPVFLFVNKMDQPGTEKETLLMEIRERLDDRCLDFTRTDSEDFLENLAMCDEAVLEQYLETGRVNLDDICDLIAVRRIFPCFFGSALKLQGVQELIRALAHYMKPLEYPEKFGARVYKIGRDKQGNRLTYLKVVGGTLKVKMPLLFAGSGDRDAREEKVDQIRIYSGADYEMVPEAKSGTVCAVTGLTETFSGQGLGIAGEGSRPLLEPVLTYQILLPEGSDPQQQFLRFRQLEEEEPLLHLVWKEQLGEIHVQVMGEVQLEILKSLIEERFGVEVTFGPGSIVYKETIKEAVEGVGHFEPLRHYAEAHILLEPLPAGSGVEIASDCSEDLLDRNWQRLILTHLAEKQHVGVLTGSEVTDIRMTLIAGKAHQKHTEGGDFRQATYRAVRQGLKKAESILLEPVYAFELEVPAAMVGRAMTDIQNMRGNFELPDTGAETAVLKGTAPVAAMEGYAALVAAYTKGTGRLLCTLNGYEPCRDPDAVVAAAGYDSERDLENPTGSVFCAHGAGYTVSWDQVEAHMHVASPLTEPEKPEEAVLSGAEYKKRQQDAWASEKELTEIFERTYGPVKRTPNTFKKTKSSSVSARRTIGKEADTRGRQTGRQKQGEKEYFLVDGYNIIFAWEELKELAMVNMEAARNKLMDILCNYQGYKKNTLIVVFDAYKVKGNPGEVLKYHNIHVVYTKEAETADQYIEKTVHEIGRKYQVTVATSDALEQVIILGQGGTRMSAAGLKEEISAMEQEIRSLYLNKGMVTGNYLFGGLSEELTEQMEAVRLGKKDFTEILPESDDGKGDAGLY